MSGCQQRSGYLKLIPRAFQFSGIAISCSVPRKKTAKIPMCFAKSTSAVLHRILNLQCLTLLMRQRFGYKQRDSDGVRKRAAEMTFLEPQDFKKKWKEIVSSFLKLGAPAYGGPAIYGMLQAELQEKRQWVSKEQFVEGVSLANLIPGATMTQLCMFLGYAVAVFGVVCLQDSVSCFLPLASCSRSL